MNTSGDMRKFRSGKWTWTAAEELGEHPENLLAGSEEIKVSQIRRVVKHNGYVLKLDMRSGRRATAEWKCFELLRRHGIPAVEPLGCGESPLGSCLITREFQGGEDASRYYYRTFVREGRKDEIFLHGFTSFVRKMLDSDLFHPDFHYGNMMYNAADGKFVLVDPLGVREAGWADRMFRMYRMRRIVLELRQELNEREMLNLIGECGIENAEDFWNRALDKEADSLWDEWPKRHRQILAGYPKFTRMIDGVLHVINPLREMEDIIDYQAIKGNEIELEGMFLAHFFLQLAHIPHRKAGGFDRTNRLIYLEQVPTRAVPCPPGELGRRLEVLGYQSEPTDWMDEGNGRIKFYNLKNFADFLQDENED